MAVVHDEKPPVPKQERPDLEIEMDRKGWEEKG